MSENPHLLANEIHGTFGTGITGTGFAVRITGLHNEYPTGVARNKHIYDRVLREYYRNLSNHGFDGYQADAVDAGFTPLTFTGFFDSSVNTLLPQASISIPFKIKGDTSSALDVTFNGVTERFTDAAQFVAHSESFADTNAVTVGLNIINEDGRFNGGNCSIVGGTTNFNPVDESNNGNISVTWDGSSSEVTIDFDIFID